MRPVTVTQTGVGSTQVVPIDIYQTTAIALGVTITAPVTDALVQHTFDDVFAPTFNPATATWFAHETLVGLSANADGNYTQPPRGIRMTIVAGTGSARLQIVQAGVMG